VSSYKILNGFIKENLGDDVGYDDIIK